jgi:hypothetical protein
MSSHEDRRAEWRLLLAEHATSGLTPAVWCRERSITPRAFSYWKGVLNPSSAKVIPTKKWLKVEPSISTEASREIQSLTVRVGSAWVEVNPGFDQGLLYDVVKALGGVQ